MAVEKQNLKGKVFFELQDVKDGNIQLPSLSFNSKEIKLLMNDIENETDEYSTYALKKSKENLFIGVMFFVLNIALVIFFCMFFVTFINLNFGLFSLYFISFVLLLILGISLNSVFISKYFCIKMKLEPITTERELKSISENLISEKSKKYIKQFSVKRKYHIFSVMNYNYYNKFLESEKELSEILEK